jgi:DNA-binding NarL/FixJ family response regulator
MKADRRMNQPQHCTILVVDDEPDIRTTLAKRLSKWQFKVLTAENGYQAMALIQSASPHVVITDLFMPQGNGFELLHHLRATAPELPVIVVSGMGDRDDVIEALRLGAWDYLYKPIENASFLRLAINRVLEKAQLLSENRAYRDHLECLVAQKSADLLDQQKILMDKTVGLEKANEALKSLLDQREIEKNAIEQTMVGNLKRFVFPYLDELEGRSLDKRTAAYLNIIRTNIEQLISPVSKNLGGAYRGLTPAEIKVADLVRQGESTKSIAAVLNTSPSTVEKHRNSIRRKLKILNKKLNLQTYLNSLS